MQGATLVIALTLGLIGLLLISFLLRLIFSSLIGDGRSFLDRFKLRQKQALLNRADVYIKANDYEAAASFLKGSFFLNHIKRDLKLVDSLNNHHLAVLGRIIAIADRFSIHLENLPIVEDLLLSRAQLMRAQIEKRQSRNLAKSRGSALNKNLPEWAVTEFNTQIENLQDKIETNRKSLESQISRLFAALVNVRKNEEVTYH